MISDYVYGVNCPHKTFPKWAEIGINDESENPHILKTGIQIVINILCFFGPHMRLREW